MPDNTKASKWLNSYLMVIYCGFKIQLKNYGQIHQYLQNTFENLEISFNLRLCGTCFLTYKLFQGVYYGPRK